MVILTPHPGIIEPAITMAIISNMALFPVLLMAAILLYLPVKGFLSTKRDPKAVPSIRSNFPFIGHILGILKYKNEYYERLR